MIAQRKAMPPPFLPITHVVCDCDGVLVDSESVAYVALLHALSTRLQYGDLAQAIQQRLGLTIDVLIAQVSALAGVHFAEADIAAMRSYVESEVRARQVAVPGIADALKEIGLPVAVASNSSLMRVREAVICSGVGPYVGDRLFTADVVGVPKPAPDIYLAACAGFTDNNAKPAPTPATCLAVEDSVAGVRAAVSAGLQVLGFAGGSHISAGPGGAAHLTQHVQTLRNAGALAVFDDMRALPGIVVALQNRAQRSLVQVDAQHEAQIEGQGDAQGEAQQDRPHYLDRAGLIRLEEVLSDASSSRIYDLT